MDIDLTGQTRIKHEYEVHAITKVLTITFKDASDVVLGTIEIEEARYRPFMDALGTVSRQLYDEYAQGIRDHRSSLRILTKEGQTDFF
jgi:hypothetical protein